jgi:vancomycin resistance protein YoaR
MISGGRLVDSVGGGIGQVATTLYNADRIIEIGTR